MKTSYFASAMIGALSLVGAMALSTGAQAATDTLVHGVYYGGGNDYPDGNWTVGTLGNAEFALRAHETGEAAPEPTGNVYDFASGQNVSFDWSYDPVAFGTPGDIGNLASLITITNVGTGGSASFSPVLFAGSHNTSGGGQESWQLGFGFLNGGSLLGDVDYSSTVASTYQLDWTVGGNNVTSVVINQAGGFAGGAVPEPSSWALMILGFGGLGGVMRKRRAMTKTAFA